METQENARKLESKKVTCTGNSKKKKNVMPKKKDKGSKRRFKIGRLADATKKQQQVEENNKNF